MIIKTVITDSAGVEHIFPEDEDVQNFLDFSPKTPSGKNIKGSVRITTRTFNGKDVYDSESVSTFLFPRRVDVLYGGYDGGKK